MTSEAFESVWDAIEDTPSKAESMKLRSKVMMAVERHIRARKWTQAEAARQLGVTQPRVSDLLRGKIDLFNLETLIDMAERLGLQVDLRVVDNYGMAA